MTPPTLATEEESLVDTRSETGESGAHELSAAVMLAIAAAFFWWRGFRTFTVAGSALFIVALLRLAAYRRRLSVGGVPPRSRVERVETTAILLALLAFPALLVAQWIGPPSPPNATAGADLWLGAVLYVMGIMELVELATLRALE